MFPRNTSVRANQMIELLGSMQEMKHFVACRENETSLALSSRKSYQLCTCWNFKCNSKSGHAQEPIFFVKAGSKLLHTSHVFECQDDWYDINSWD